MNRNRIRHKPKKKMCHTNDLFLDENMGPLHRLYCVGSIVRVAKQRDDYATKSEKLTRFNGEKHTIVFAMLLIFWQTNEKKLCVWIKAICRPTAMHLFQELIPFDFVFVLLCLSI